MKPRVVAWPMVGGGTDLNPSTRWSEMSERTSSEMAMAVKLLCWWPSPRCDLREDRRGVRGTYPPLTKRQNDENNSRWGRVEGGSPLAARLADRLNPQAGRPERG